MVTCLNLQSLKLGTVESIGFYFGVNQIKNYNVSFGFELTNSEWRFTWRWQWQERVVPPYYLVELRQKKNFEQTLSVPFALLRQRSTQNIYNYYK